MNGESFIDHKNNGDFFVVLMAHISNPGVIICD